MNRGKSKEVAFFNLLKSLISPNIKNEVLEYSISVEDLKEKMSMDKKIISSFLGKLQEDGLLQVLENTDDRVDLHFEKTHDKLLEFMTVDDLDDVILDIKDFISRNIVHFQFHVPSKVFNDYAQEALVRQEAEGIDFDMTDIIERGVNDIFNREETIVYVNRKLFDIANEAKEEDLKVLEGIFYCCLNLPPVENPFYITLFVAKLCFQMEMCKREMIS